MRTIFLLLIPYLSFGQETFKNFTASAEESFIYWQKVYETDETISSLISRLNSNGIFEDIQEFESSVRGKIKGLVPSLSGTGIKRGATGVEFDYIVYDASFLVEFRDGRYRVTIDNIMSRFARDGVFSREGETTPLIKVATTLNGKRIHPRFPTHTATILDVNFNNNFELINNNKDNW